MAQQGDDTPLDIPWANPIGTRDGTLTQDAKMVNCYLELTQNGNAVVKRPGSSKATFLTMPPAGTGQGLVGTVGLTGWAIVNDILYSLTGGPNIPIPSVTLSNQPYTYAPNFPNSDFLYIKSNVGLWKVQVSTNTITKVTDINYPLNTVNGIAELDGVLYVMDPTGRIAGSAINDGTTWPALDFVSPDSSYGAGAGIHRHLQYICAFYTQGLILYYDANAAPNGQGIALNPVSSAIWKTGSPPVADTIQELSDVTYWVAQTGTFRYSVQALQGLEMVTISTPFVEKILTQIGVAGMTSLTLSPSGHQFYIISSAPTVGSISLAYDAVTQQWAVWTLVSSGFEESYSYNFGRIIGAGQYVQRTDGTPMLIQPTVYQDDAEPINVVCVTPNMDWGSMNWKRFGYMNQFADTVSTTVSVSFTDNDYQTFSNPRTIDLSTVRKQLRNCGSSRRRAWKLTHSDNTSLKLYSMKATSTGLAR